MRNPYKLYEGEPISEIMFDVGVYPGSHFAHILQINRESDLPTVERIRNCASAIFVEGLRFAAYGMIAHEVYEFSKKLF